MTNALRWGLAAVATGFLCACSSSPQGTAGAGGRDGIGGANGGASGTDGGLDGPSCLGYETVAQAQSSGQVGPLSTTDEARPPLGWTYVGPYAVDGGAAAAAGAADAGTEGDASASAHCLSVPNSYMPGTSCRGTARLQQRTTGPVIALDDGTELIWNGDLPVSFQPYVQEATGVPVWIDYEQRWVTVCPVCGAYATASLQIRDGEGGKVRFFAQTGVVLPTLTDAQVMDVFGVNAQAVPSCSLQATAGCSRFVRTEYDHVLSTTPAQTIYHGDWTGSVDAPNGRYQVYWSSSTESDFQQVPNCADGPGVATDNGFVAALVMP